MMADKRMKPEFTPPFDLLLGRRTYDIFAAHWPYMEDTDIGAMFAKIDKYVLTGSDAPLDWKGRLCEQRVTPGGMVMSTYEPSGPVETASFGMDQPSDQELARRERIDAGAW